MKNTTKAIIASLFVVLVAGIAWASTASASDGDDVVIGPILVNEPDGTHECNSTWQTVDTKTGTRIETYEYEVEIPGEDEVSHQEYRYSRTIPDEVIEDTYRTEYLYEKEVQDYKTQYHFRKHTRPWVRGHFDKSVRPWVWIDGHWGDWNKTYNSHQSWQDSSDPLGTPQPHRDGQWQARWDGETREIEDGTHTEQSGWTTEILTDPWVKINERDVSNEDGYTIPGYTEFYVNGGTTSLTEDDSEGSDQWTEDDVDATWTQIDERKVVDKEAVPPRTEIRTGEREVEYEYTVTTYYEAGWECPVESTTTTTTEPEVTTTTTVPVSSTTTTPATTTTAPTTTTTIPDVDPCIIRTRINNTDGTITWVYTSYDDGFFYGFGDEDDLQGWTRWSVDACYVPVTTTTTEAPTTTIDDYIERDGRCYRYNPTTASYWEVDCDLADTGNGTKIVLGLAMVVLSLGVLAFVLARRPSKSS